MMIPTPRQQRELAQWLREMGWRPDGRGGWSKRGWCCCAGGAAVVEGVAREKYIEVPNRKYVARSFLSEVFERTQKLSGECHPPG